MNKLPIENSNPIVIALKHVFELFDIKKNVGILLPESSPEEIGRLVEKSSEDNFVIVYFNFLKDKEQDKWIRDTYRFWCGFFERLGIGYDGSDVIYLVNQIKNSNKNHDEWHYKLFKYIKNNQSIANLIREKDYSFARVSHNSIEEKDEGKLKLSYLVTALRESILWEFKAKNSFRILIIDDRLYESEQNEEDKKKVQEDIISLLKICSSVSIDCYGLVKNGDTEFGEALQEVLKSLSNNENGLKTLVQKFVLNDSAYKLETYDSDLFFDYLLVDLWHKDTESIRGLGLISELHYKIQEIVRKGKLSFKKEDGVKEIPEILAYSVSGDAETIQMAHRMGAAGYVVKKIPESLILAIIRAGSPLKQNDATCFDFLSSNNFPIIARIPRQIAKNLFHSEISRHDIDGKIKNNAALEWLRKIPKPDLHVHFGTAIPLKWCYILSMISLIHWKTYWKNTGNIKECVEMVKSIVGGLENVIKEVLKDNPERDFRRKFLLKFSKEYGMSEAVFLKDIIVYLASLSRGLLYDKQIACLINVLLGKIIFKKDDWKGLYVIANNRLEQLKEEVKKGEETRLHTLKFLRDCRYMIQSIESWTDLDDVNEIINLDKIDPDKGYNFDPLSEMLSTDVVEHPYGLERYLAASDLVGSSLLQFTDTLLLASMSIPEWASAKKKKEDTNEKGENQENTENVIHLELRTTPQGYLRPYRSFNVQDNTIAAKLICVGLEFGTKCLLKDASIVSANLLLSIKRDRDRSNISDMIRIAVDMREEYKSYLKLHKKEISSAEGFMIPHVAGLDIAGIERNNLPDELLPYYREAFERCLLSTIHAGETEPARSVRDAIFMLSASRIGHGLSIKKDIELQEMVADRSMCVELCPKSNQFTNDFTIFSPNNNEIKNENEYVYSDFRKDLVLSVNTDNPTISHRTKDCFNFVYPLSEEYIWLAGMINYNKYRLLSRLEVLRLIYNGFISMFAPEQAKKYIIGLADDEILSLLAEEYLDIDMRIGNEK